MKRQLAAAQASQEKALERQRVELSGSAEAMLAEKAKEARVEQLTHKAIKRICNQGIMRGFSAWSEQYFAAARQKRMLAAAGARLARPALAAAVAHWRADWDAATAARATQGMSHEV